jgi:diguanylate cyclase (GGDEF)-like protein
MTKKYLAAFNRERIFNSIVTRLLLMALFIIMLGGVLRFYVLSNFLREDLGATAQSQQLALAGYVAQDIDSKIVQRERLLGRIASAIPEALLSQPQLLGQWLAEHAPYQTSFTDGFFVLDAQGQLIAGDPVVNGCKRSTYSDCDYVQAALSGQPSVGSPQAGRGAKGPLIPVSAPIKSPDGKVSAVLVGVAALAAPGFLDSLFHNRVEDTGDRFLLVFPADKVFIASSPVTMALRPLPAPGIDKLHDQAMAGFRGAGITVNAQGGEEVAAMASIPVTGWFVVARQPTSETFATVDRLQHFLLQGALGAILVFGSLSALGIYYVFRQLFHAAAQADRMTRDGEVLTPLQVVRNDEIGHLISAFNRLMFKLDDKQAELERLAHHDALTGLPNRAHLSRRLRQSLVFAKLNGTHVGLLFMDLDGFKHINDSLGHEAGDEVLRQVAARFATVLRKTDILARIGGDEFVVLLGNLEHDAEEVVAAVAAKCIDALTAPFYIAGTVCVVGVSIGIAWGSGSSSADALLVTADRVMYQAKKSGRGRYVSCKL